ncbi:mannonate dehydratase [Planktotalea sp.]|uniref:mannonate dehydratase n=1 Tax=Planktotalea sp. TaxID=2029877 RepID=UPI003D6B7C5A
MKQCWRWFGPNDAITLTELHQAGVEGIATALYDLPAGIAWGRQNLLPTQDMLRAHGYAWDVVDCLPVSEAIKTQTGDMAAHIEAYKQSLKAIAGQGISTVCYSFSPVFDWTRTNLRAQHTHGGTSMLFQMVEFAVFDLFILKRDGACEAYSEGCIAQAQARFDAMSEEEKSSLQSSVLAGLPHAYQGANLDELRALIETYATITPEKLRANLIDFLSEVAPIAQEFGVNLGCHPDDPPFSLLGLPKVVSSYADYAAIFGAVDIPANGAVLCTGALGVCADFDGPAFVRRHGARIHFAHLRNTTRLDSADATKPDFYEAAHLEGNTDIVGTVRALMDEQRRRKEAGRDDWVIPMCADHGQELLSDLGRPHSAGSPLIGRMRGLAELRGIIAACA